MAHPEVSSVIAGVTKPEQVAANARAGKRGLTAAAVAAAAARTEG